MGDKTGEQYSTFRNWLIEGMWISTWDPQNLVVRDYHYRNLYSVQFPSLGLKAAY